MRSVPRAPVRPAVVFLGVWVFLSASAALQAETFFQQAAKAQKKGDTHEAIRLYTRAIERDQLDTSDLCIAYKNRGAARKKLGAYGSAEGDYDQAIELDPHDADAYHGR